MLAAEPVPKVSSEPVRDNTNGCQQNAARLWAPATGFLRVVPISDKSAPTALPELKNPLPFPGNLSLAQVHLHRRETSV